MTSRNKPKPKCNFFITKRYPPFRLKPGVRQGLHLASVASTWPLWIL